MLHDCNMMAIHDKFDSSDVGTVPVCVSMPCILKIDRNGRSVQQVLPDQRAIITAQALKASRPTCFQTSE